MSRKALRIIYVLALLILAVSVLAGCSNEEKEAAITAFNTECERINSETATLQDLITECEGLIEAAAEPYEPETFTELQTATTKASASIQELPQQPGKTEDIISATEDLAKISYTSETDALTAARDSYQTSLKIMEQITNPDEAFVISCLEQIEGITGYAAVTEDNDPNGQLNKQGGYTAAVVFSYDKVDQSQAYGSTIIEKGTDCGGQIEVYETAENAAKRNSYLASFDGGILSSGSHTVLGTMVVRTSNLLTATQQKDLEAALIQVFTTLQE